MWLAELPYPSHLGTIGSGGGIHVSASIIANAVS
jgi:hypothetical protein